MDILLLLLMFSFSLASSSGSVYLCIDCHRGSLNILSTYSSSRSQTRPTTLPSAIFMAPFADTPSDTPIFGPRLLEVWRGPDSGVLSDRRLRKIHHPPPLLAVARCAIVIRLSTCPSRFRISSLLL
jgi:hypothetical protein